MAFSLATSAIAVYFLMIFGTVSCNQHQALSVVVQQDSSESGDDALVEDDASIQQQEESERQVLTEEIFIPTSEWQTVKPGQNVPRGLHVRLDMTTGQKEAKLMEKQGDETTDSSFRVWEDGKRKGVVNTDHKFFTINEIKEALKDLKEEDGVSKNADDQEDLVKSQFRPYSELKEDFVKLNMNVKTENEIMRELLAEFKMENCSDDRKLEILEDLEYYVHQIDNAQNFVDMGGFTLLRHVFNHTDSKFRAMAAYLLGSASQSNPKVQIAAIDNGLFHQIIQSFGKEGERDAVRKKYLYALCSILRHFPFAQKKFLELGGTEIFVQIFQRGGHERQKIKILTLLFDLILEKKQNTEDTVDAERRRQYEKVALMESLVEKGWCRLVPELLNLPDWDSQEKVLLAMNVMFPECKTDFVKSLRTLSLLKAQYESELKNAEKENDYLRGLLRTVDQMIQSWTSSLHEEL